MTKRIWIGALLMAFVALTMTAHARWATRAGAGDAPGEMAPNEFGVAESVHRTNRKRSLHPAVLHDGVVSERLDSLLDPVAHRDLQRPNKGLRLLDRPKTVLALRTVTRGEPLAHEGPWRVGVLQGPVFDGCGGPQPSAGELSVGRFPLRDWSVGRGSGQFLGRTEVAARRLGHPERHRGIVRRSASVIRP